MGPSFGKSRRRKPSSSRKGIRRRRRRTLFKKHIQSTNTNISDCSSATNAETVGTSCYDEDFSECSTPKAERFRIPEIKTCPPPPKKTRTIKICSLGTPPITFFTPPDIDLFFHFALRGIPA